MRPGHTYDLDSALAIGSPLETAYRYSSAPAPPVGGYSVRSGPPYARTCDLEPEEQDQSAKHTMSHVPPTLTDKNWRQMNGRQPNSASFSQPFRDATRSDDYYQRYLQLASNVAYKHPNPGVPRERMGRIGGSWRHIKEVLGYTGSQVCFVDGLVSLYDLDAKKNGSARSPVNRARMAGPTGYSANMAIDRESTFAAEQQDALAANSKYKGFYTLRQ